MMLFGVESDEVVSFLRKGSQGPGLTLELVGEWVTSQHEINPMALINVSAEELLTAIRQAVSLIGDSDNRVAIAFALNLTMLGSGSPGATLTDRRAQAMEQLDVSPRTIIRYEELGAQAIADLLPKVIQQRSEVQQLKARFGETGAEIVKRMEELVCALNERLDDIEAMLLLVASGSSVTTEEFSVTVLQGDDGRWKVPSNPFKLSYERMIERYVERVQPPDGEA